MRSTLAGVRAPTVLDLGTERGHTASEILRHWPSAVIDGVDCHAAEVIRAQATGSYRDVYLQDAVDYLKSMGNPKSHLPLSYDVVIAAELIEHMTKPRGFDLLTLVRKRAHRLAIVTSPIGYLKQGEIDGNPHQEHVSGWAPGDFVRQLFDVELLTSGPPASGQFPSLGVYKWLAA